MLDKINAFWSKISGWRNFVLGIVAVGLSLLTAVQEFAAALPGGPVTEGATLVLLFNVGKKLVDGVLKAVAGMPAKP